MMCISVRCFVSLDNVLVNDVLYKSANDLVDVSFRDGGELGLVVYFRQAFGLTAELVGRYDADSRHYRDVFSSSIRS